MHRVRMSLPYYKSFGWEAELVTVNPKHSEISIDEMLLKNIPNEIIIHQVEAFNYKWTRKFGLGSIALRSLWFYKKRVNQILKNEHFDLIFFSTTQFPLLILGNYWKNKFKIPYVIDMQDPWHSTYYNDKPVNERPPKYWFSYQLNKYLEPIAMNAVDGLISVSQGYLDTLENRYKRLIKVPQQVIPFGILKKDFEWVRQNEKHFKQHYIKKNEQIDFVYVGRGGYDMRKAVVLLFNAFKEGLKTNNEQFRNIRFHFIGTSYAPEGKGVPTILPIANEMGITAYVNEQTDRISLYQSIYTLMNADALIILGSEDQQYTGSKVFPYIMAERPLLAILHPESSATQILLNCNAADIISIMAPENQSTELIYNYLYKASLRKILSKKTNWPAFDSYSAENLCKQQCELFNKVLIS